MKTNTFLLAAGMFYLLVQGLVSCAEVAEPKEDKVATMAQSVERGKYLVTIMGCNDCHSSTKMTDRGPMPDPDFLLAGHPAQISLAKVDDPTVMANYVLFSMVGTAITGPWGTSFAANLTPDESGIGNWSFEQFKTAMTKGKYKGMENGRDLLPPMPWPNYINMDTTDLKDLYNYLMSLDPVRNIVPQPIPPATF